MAEKSLTNPQHRTKEGALVIPLDDPRTYDYDNTTVTALSGPAYTPCSGKDIYIKELIATELSGTDSRLWLQDSSGHIIPPINIDGNTTTVLQVRPAAIGPTHGTIYYETETAARFYGEITLVVQVDPKRIE